jgi:hypothetical protein
VFTKRQSFVIVPLLKARWEDVDCQIMNEYVAHNNDG